MSEIGIRAARAITEARRNARKYPECPTCAACVAIGVPGVPHCSKCDRHLFAGYADGSAFCIECMPS